MNIDNRHEIRLAGSGGQGVILATIILAEAAVLAGHHAAQSESYGPEARGGSCKAETLISNRPIGFTKVQRPSLLVAFTQKALDQYAQGLSEQCLVIIDDTLKSPSNITEKQLVRLPLLSTARNVIGKAQTANIIAVGCINEFLGLTDKETMQQAVLHHIPKGTENLNVKALEAGMKMAADWKKGHQA